MAKQIRPVPREDANETQKAQREKAAFRNFVTEKREDYTMTCLAAILQNPNTDSAEVEENVATATAYADAILSSLYDIRRVPRGGAENGRQPEESPDPKEQ